MIVNEANGLGKDAIRALLVMLERVAAHVVWIFTTTNEGQSALFDDCDDASPLLSRCIRLDLARRDLAKPFAERTQQIAQREGLDGKPIGNYVKLAQEHRNKPCNSSSLRIFANSSADDALQFFQALENSCQFVANRLPARNFAW